MEEKIDIAIAHFWNKRDRQKKDHLKKHGTSRGTGASVSANTHLDTFAKIIYNSVNYQNEDIVSKHLDYSLPGWYRPLKNWDVVIKKNNSIAAAIELKSMAGESFGKNINHRTEEAVGTAQDLIASHSMGLIDKRPWMGYVYLIDSNDLSEKHLSTSDEKMDNVFFKASYVDRIKIMGERMVESGLYDAVWFIKTSEDLSWSEPSKKLGHKNFFNLLRAHISDIM